MLENIVSDRNARSFIKQLQVELKRGYGFVILAGAGLSANAGVPVITQLSHYLQRCIALALGVDVVSNHGTGEPMRRWHPRSDAWPPLADRLRPDDTDWFGYLYREWFHRAQSRGWNPELRVFQEALGAMAEWRSSLLFLSRLASEVSGADQQESLFLDDPRQDVVDAFFLHVTGGRPASHAHRMLAHLSAVLRTPLVLSTNFDDLIEQAFDAAGKSLRVFDIHISDGLPHLVALGGSCGLIKLHGGRFSLRADYSLDAIPTEHDRQRFTEYLSGRTLGSDSNSVSHVTRNHLLVTGLSAADRRITHFVDDAISRLDDLRIFWMCYTHDDFERVCVYGKKHKDVIIPLRYDDLGLVLQQAYQCLNGSLPPNGIVFPSISRVPMPPQVVPGRELSHEARATAAALYTRIEKVQDRTFTGRRLVVFVSHADIHGVTTLASVVFDQLRDKGQTCLWLDLNDISSTDDLFEQLLDAVWYACGTEEWMSTYLEQDPQRRARELGRGIQASGRNWVLFLNGRETPGSNLESYTASQPNGWLDRDPAPGTSDVALEVDNSATHGPFIEFICELCGEICPTLTVVLLARNPRTDGLEAPLLANLARRGAIGKSGFNPSSWIVLPESCVKFKTDDVVQAAFKWANDGPSRHVLLHALVLMQRNRFIACFWNPAFVSALGIGPDMDVDGAIRFLEQQCNLVRWKSGGFVWLHTPVRNELRRLYRALYLPDAATSGHLAAADLFRDLLAGASHDSRTHNPARLQIAIARWYYKVFVASQRPGAAFEALYHACEAARWELDLDHSGGGERLQLATEHITWASRLLHSADHIIRTRGFSKSSCRRLGEMLRAMAALRGRLPAGSGRSEFDPLLQAILEAEKQCLITMRGIAREVAENSTCFKRHRQLRSLILSTTTFEEGAKHGREKSVPFFHDGGEIPVNKALALWATGFEPRQRSDSAPAAKPRQYLWIRWWRWTGMISNAARTSEAAEYAFLIALDSLSEEPDVLSAARRARLRKSKKMTLHQFQKWLRRVITAAASEECLCHKVPCPKPSALRDEVVSVLEQYVQLLLQWDHICGRLGRRSGDCIGAARICIAEATSLLDGDGSASFNFSARAFRASKMRIRLLSHCAIIEAKKGERNSAMSLLNEADAELDNFDPKREGSSWARLCVHRAEVFLRLALDTKVHRNMTWLSNCGDLIRMTLSKGDSSLKVPKRPNARLQIGGDLRDAAVALDQAEKGLLSRRKNVWWATWMFQRRLQLIECDLWLAIWDIGEPIPYLGLEAAPRQTETLADQCLHNVCRMVRRNVSMTLRHWRVEFSVACVAEVPDFGRRLAG